MLFKDFSYILRAFDMKFSQTFFKSYGEIIWNWALQKLVQIYQGGSPGEIGHREFCLKQKKYVQCEEYVMCIHKQFYHIQIVYPMYESNFSMH